MEIKKQSKQLSVIIGQNKLKSKMFYKWVAKYQKAINSYELKNKAVEAIWAIKVKDANVEKKRAFFIWKDTLHQLHLKQDRIKKLIWGIYFNRLSVAYNTWQNHVSNVDT